MNQSTAIPSFVAAAALSACLTAQTPADHSIERLLPLHDAPADPEGGPYGIWGAGPGYKVSFHQGLELLPCVGKAALEPPVLRWQTVGCRVGALELPVLPAGAPTRWSATRAEFDHGSFVEAYDLREDGVEQTFVFATRPAATGDLIIEGQLRGLVPAAGSADAEELMLCSADGQPRLFYGAATAIAADGDRCAVPRSVAGSRIALVVPAQWLATAVWPITVDPLLRPNTALGFSRRVVAVDLLRDDFEEQHNVWLATTIEDAATGDRDLIVQRLHEDFTDPRDVFVDVTTSWRTNAARLAAVGATNRVVTAFVRELSSGNALRWHLHGKSDLARSTLIGSVPRPAGAQDSLPAVGGTNAFAAGRNALLAWQRDVAATPTNTNSSRVFVALLDTAGSGQGVLGTAVLVENSGTGDDDAPSINQEAEGGAGFSWAVAWLRREVQIGTMARVAVRLVDQGGVPTAARVDVPTGFPLHPQGPPRIAGQRGRYLIVHGRRDSGGGFHEMVAVRLDWPHGQPEGTLPHGAFSIEADNSVEAHLHGLAFDTTTRCHWLVTRRNAAFEQLRAFKLGFRGRTVEVEDLPLQGDRVPLHSAVAFDDDSDRFLIAAAVQPLLPTTPGAVQFDAMLYEPVAPIADYGVGCAPGRLAWNGSQHLGDEFTALALLQSRPSTLAFVALALTQSSVELGAAGMPGCFLLANPSGPGGIGVVAATTDAGGRLDVPLPLPEGLAPMVLHAQSFLLVPGSNAAGAIATRGLRVGIGR